MKKKIMLILILVASLFLFTGCKPSEKNDDDNEPDISDISKLEDALIEIKADLPKEFVKGSKAPNFIDYFSIRDQRQDIEVLDEYIDKGTFDINVSGEYAIKLSYKGKNLRTVFKILNVKVIDADNEAPQIFSVLPEYFLEINEDVSEFYVRFHIVDNVDGKKKFESNADIQGMDKVDITKLNGRYPIVFEVEDKAGNKTRIESVINIVDRTAPNIFNVKALKTRKGKVIDYKGHIVFEDNYDTPEKIIKEFKVRSQDYDPKREGVEAEKNYVKDIDFNVLGTHYVEVYATDSSGNKSAPKLYKVVVENGAPFGLIILYVNLIGLGVLLIAGGIAAIILVPRYKAKKDQEKANQTDALKE